MSRLIGQRRLDQLDYDNLATYLDDMAAWDRRELNSRLRRLMLHLLKWIYQPAKRILRRLETICMERFELQGMLTSKVLMAQAQSQAAALYVKARKQALRQGRLPKRAIPDGMPFSLEQVLSDDWPKDLVWRPKRQKTSTGDSGG